MPTFLPVGCTAFSLFCLLSPDALGASPPPAARSPKTVPSGLVQPADLTYLGAFRLPGTDPRPQTFEYGGNAMTFRPGGDPGSPADGFPGSLFVMGHDRIPYGELPNGNQVAEVSIPVPVVSNSIDALSTATFLHGFTDVDPVSSPPSSPFDLLQEVPTTGMQVLNTAATGERVHLAWGQHFQPDPPAASHAWFSPTLSAPAMTGFWFIGTQSQYSVNNYMMEIPQSWANAHTGGKPLGTGRHRDGGWGGMGPSLYAYQPWTDASGTPAPSGTQLQETVLLHYEDSETTEDPVRCLSGYQHADTFVGGAFLTTAAGKSAVTFAGTKGTGAKYWYGWINPLGPSYPCVEESLIGQFTLCRFADGTPCPVGDLTECAGHTSNRGWWSSRLDAQILFYDPEDLASVASGAVQPYVPQPYATLDIGNRLFLNPGGAEIEMLGSGVQRRYHLGDVTFDRQSGFLYVLEQFADGVKPVIHVWRVGQGAPAAAKFYSLAPCRLVDTRNADAPLAGPVLAAGASRLFDIRNVCGVPTTAGSVSLNLTVTQPASPGYLTLFPGSATPPLASSINFRAGQTRANNAITPLASDGSGTIGILNGSSGNAHVIVDVNGYFQ
jgi:hypothetical protein